MIARPHFTYIAAATPEQTQAREAAANEEWRKRLLMSHTTPLPRNENTKEPIWRYVHGTPDFRRPEPEPQPIARPLVSRNEDIKEPIWRYVHGTPAPPPKTPPPPKPERIPTREEGGERREIINEGPPRWYILPRGYILRNVKLPTPEPLPKREEGGERREPQPIVSPPNMNIPKDEVKFGVGRLPTPKVEGNSENLVQDVLSVLNRTPIVTSPGVRVEPQPIVLPPRNENTTISTPEPTPPGLRVEPQPIVRPIENPPRSEPGSIPPWLRIEPLPTVEPPVYITPPNVNPPTPTPEPTPPGLRTEPLPTMPTPVFSPSSVSPTSSVPRSGSPMGPPPILPMAMPFGGGNNQEIGGMAADMIYL